MEVEKKVEKFVTSKFRLYLVSGSQFVNEVVYSKFRVISFSSITGNFSTEGKNVFNSWIHLEDAVIEAKSKKYITNIK